ncbi:MAG TPA: LysE family translocator [Actinomycetota bacterium]
MPSPEVFAAFAVASLALLIVPGPSVLYIVTRSVDQGKTAGLVSVLGIHTGSIVHVVAAALGLSAILASSALAFGIVKYAGAAYLIWLGIKAIRARGEERTEPRGREHSLARIYAQGVVVNVLNPKTALFFLAFLPQFVDVSKGSVPLQAVIFGALSSGWGSSRTGRTRWFPPASRSRDQGTTHPQAGTLAPRSDLDRSGRRVGAHGPPLRRRVALSATRASVVAWRRDPSGRGERMRPTTRTVDAAIGSWRATGIAGSASWTSSWSGEGCSSSAR